MQQNIFQKNQTMMENKTEKREFEGKNEDMDSPYNIQENKKPQQRSQQLPKESNKSKDSKNKQENSYKRQKSPKDRKQIKTPDFLKVIQRHTNFPAIYVLIPIISCGLFVLFGSFEVVFTNLIGLVFPIYWTMRAFNDKNAIDDERQWYTYWLIYLAMIPLDLLLGRFLKHIPLLYFAKYVFLCWMFLPNFKGANYIHDMLIKKNFPDFVNKIDKSSQSIRHQFQDFTSRIQSRFMGNQPQEVENRQMRLKKLEKAAMDNSADLKNDKVEDQNIHKNIGKKNLEHEDKHKISDKDKKEFSKNKEKEHLEASEQINLKDIFDDKLKIKKENVHEQYQEHLPTNESETDIRKEPAKHSEALKNVISEKEIYKNKGEDKNLTEKPFKELKDKEIEAEKPFKGGKKMPDVDNGDYQNKENIQSENTNLKKEKKNDLKDANVNEKESDKKGDLLSFQKKENQMVKQ